MKFEIWTEKYRPKRLDEVIKQRHVVSRLKVWVKAGSIPNLLFAGPAGVGKTTVALCLAKELFGEHWQENFQETNASDERGINVIRGRIKDFARTKPIGADFKIVFLDESDALTPEAQQALRRTMERFSNICRFILSCNYSSHIIEPIQSRCAIFRFKRLSKEDVKAYIKRIVENEGIEIDESGYSALFEISEGDLRSATNLLQAASTLGKITRDSIYEAASLAKPEDIKEMIKYALNGEFDKAKEKLYDLLINQGLAGEDIIKNMHRLIYELQIPNEKKIELLSKVAEYEFRLNQGGSAEIQLEALLAQFMSLS
ncbi:MAG TPA: replication factor C small subunit [Candidatus Aenigmarchaeota archaeon]|nr:replication factor C small subunit [Candidatus Aenigmarchaeota archaeon]